MGKVFLCGISKVPHKISHPYCERCAFYLDVKILELLDLWAQKRFWNDPQFQWSKPEMGVTKPIFSVPLFSGFFFSIVGTHVSYWISRLYSTAELRRHLSNMNVIHRTSVTVTFARSKILPTEKLTNGALITPSPALWNFRVKGNILVVCNWFWICNDFIYRFLLFHFDFNSMSNIFIAFSKQYTRTWGKRRLTPAWDKMPVLVGVLMGKLACLIFVIATFISLRVIKKLPRQSITHLIYSWYGVSSVLYALNIFLKVRELYKTKVNYFEVSHEICIANK